jgi:hypothetical protein
MLHELRRFSTDERGLSEIVTLIAVAVILVLAVVVFYRGAIIPALQDVVNKIVACLQCALNPACTSC